MGRIQYITSASAATRLKAAREWLSAQDRAQPLLVIGGTQLAADMLVRDVVSMGGAALGWTRLTLRRFASTLALSTLAERGLAPAGSLTREAVVARVVHELADQASLGRYQAIADRPGLARALCGTFEELRMAGVEPDAPFVWSADLLRIYRAYLTGLHSVQLSDTTELFRIAAERCSKPHPLLGTPCVFLDVAVTTRVEARLIGAVGAVAPAVFACVPRGDDRSLTGLSSALKSKPRSRVSRCDGALGRVQKYLFSDLEPEPGELGESVSVVSSPGESRECVEIARRIMRLAEDGTPFDQMAVLVRSPGQYRPHLAEAFRRAAIPAWFAGGTLQRDPSGRALLALLACRAEGLTASRMAEFLSLGEAAPADADAGERAVPTVVPDDDVMPVRQVGANPDDGSLEVAPPESVVAPRRWEQLLIDAAVIGGLDRWKRRLKALDAALLVRQSALDDDASDSLGQHLERQREQLAALSDYVLPLVETLAELPDRATWGEWLTSLGALANRALKSPERVLEVLAELRPMAAVGPVGIDEVRIVLGRRLSELLVSQKGSPAGRVLVASVDEARGREFAVVFVPGLAERLFPRKVVEDPILLDSNRAPMAVGLTVSEHRVAAERLALHLAVGAATESLVLTFPRIDLESARPRVPSFYGLEVLRAAEGRLPGFEELLRRAEAHDEGDVGARRVGWPAPADPKRAIDTAEYDLAWLSQLLEAAGGRVGSARYLMEGNAHLGRALRSRYMVGQRAWTRADGLVKPRAGAHAALKKHALDQRSFSPTALQKFTGCPYRFFLYTVMRLQPREAPEFMEEMNPLERGSLVHDAQYDVLVELEKRGWLPLNQTNRLDARVVLEQVVDRLAAEYRDRLAPAIERVWEDGITLIRSDLQEWLFNLAGDTEWFPWRFELAFGRFRGDRRDPRSEPESIALDCGLSVHGSIDRVDRTRVAVAGAMALRATDTKTGRVSIGKDAVIAGGKALQPVIYALALEKMNPEATVVAGRLDFCTSRGGFEYRDVELDERARASADRLAEVLGGALDERFFPRAPGAGECRWCDFQTVCGSGPEERLPTKAAGQLLPLLSLREMP